MLGAMSLLLVAGLEYRMKMDMAENLHRPDIRRHTEKRHLSCYLSASSCWYRSGGVRHGGHQRFQVQTA